MSIENFIWDKQNQSVSWVYNGKVVKKRYEDLNSSSPDLEDNYIFISTGKDFRVDQVYYLSFEGEQIFTCDRVNGKVCWKYDNRLFEVGFKNLDSAEIYLNNDIVIVVIATNPADKILKGYALDGKLLFEINPPNGYKFEYLSFIDNSPTVVCNGGNINADAYGRSEFHFKIDTKTGVLEKIGLAY